jgi:CRP-like cAMP-binding protein
MVLQSDLELINVLKSLVPISNLSKDNIELIAASSNLKTILKDNIVFNEGDSDEYAYYLLEGELELISINNTNFRIISGTDGARYPLAQFQPRQYTANAIVDSSILVLDRTLLDSLLVGHETDNTNVTNLNSGVEVNDINSNDDGDWMTTVLQSSLFSNISVENIQKIFSRIDSIDVRKGEVIIKQGNEGDYYYIIQMGQCQISRRPTPTAQDVNIAVLLEGDAFGEEAIIAGIKRNASVTMLSNGRLMRLNKNDFKELILNPILQSIDLNRAKQLVEQGAVWLDVRYQNEYQDFSLEDGLNIPLNILRLQVDKLDRTIKYITCCDSGARSTIAAFILAQHGYDVFQLNIGLKNLFRRGKNRHFEQVGNNLIGNSDKINSEDIIPLKKSSEESGEDRYVLNKDFQYVISQLNNDLDIMREKYQEFLNLNNMDFGLKKSVADAAEEKIKSQQKSISLQTRNVNMLIEKTKKMHNELQNEKRRIYSEVEKQRQQQEEKLSHIKAEMNKRLIQEEKKMQAFYSWKANEVEKIKQMKRAAEEKYLAGKSGQNFTYENKDASDKLQELESIKQEVHAHQRQEEINDDVKKWVAEQVENETTPLNRDIAKAKKKLLEEVNKRVERAKKISKTHDQDLSNEIDALLKGSNK